MNKLRSKPGKFAGTMCHATSDDLLPGVIDAYFYKRGFGFFETATKDGIAKRLYFNASTYRPPTVNKYTGVVELTEDKSLVGLPRDGSVPIGKGKRVALVIGQVKLKSDVKERASCWCLASELEHALHQAKRLPYYRAVMLWQSLGPAVANNETKQFEQEVYHHAQVICEGYPASLTDNLAEEKRKGLKQSGYLCFQYFANGQWHVSDSLDSRAIGSGKGDARLPLDDPALNAGTTITEMYNIAKRQSDARLQSV